MLDWSTGAWHRRLTQWVYGKAMFYETHLRSTFDNGRYAGEKIELLPKQINLCPYMRRLVIAMVAAPFLFVFRALDKKVWAQVGFITATFNLSFASPISLLLNTSYLEALEYTLGATLGFGVVIGGIVGVYALKDKLAEYVKRKDNERWDAIVKGTYKYPKPKGPNPFTAFIHAKHEKICPMIEWTEPTKPTSGAATPSQEATSDGKAQTIV